MWQYGNYELNRLDIGRVDLAILQDLGHQIKTYEGLPLFELSDSAPNVTGTSASETLYGNYQANVITGSGGNDTIDGGVGIDIAKFSAPLGSISSANYSIQKLNDTAWLVSYKGPVIAIFPPPITDGTDQLTNIERLQFTDKNVALDLNGNAGTTAKIIGAVFGTESLSNKQYVGIGLSLLDTGMPTNTLSSLAVDAANLKTNDQIVSTLWKNVFGTPATSADKAPYVKLLDNGMSAGTLAWLAADTSFNTTNINLVGLAQTGIEYIPVS
jgi:Ca2+-binding RTX toxin-like protein